MAHVLITAGALLSILLAFIFHAVLYSPISPQPLPFLPSSKPPSNNILQRVEKLGEGKLVGPEDICVGKLDLDGSVLYTVSRDGWIKRMHSNGTLEDWKMIGGDGLLGITQSMDGDLLVCDAHKRVEKLGEGKLVGPEDICVGKLDLDGSLLYTVSRDGWIKRMHSNGTLEDWKMIGGDGLLGITQSMDGDLLVCDAHKGLLKVGERGMIVLASQVDGSVIRFADAVIEAMDGSVYFSDASTKFGFHDWHLDLLEARPHGRLLKYDPMTNKTSILLSNLCFANGVALSKDQDFLLVCETWRFRCLRYWLKGDLEGKVDVFIDNLPGGPDNVNLAPDGSFWIALVQFRRPGMDWIHKWGLFKKVLSMYPTIFELMHTPRAAMVANVASNGTLIRVLDDADGRVMSFVTSALEFDGHLFFGSLQNNFIGKLSLY
ncbi:hypothetical protein J5N97_005850 [Dioscorea zingiberensis]|uniref:Strictosidine synthase conserved region domain-containing protein n=1 Tax=Dioscorea zingiberensis TaxID=325984 RepID=A0A9D5D9R5_9LILI|nr:hypothetical protein J5N97_005850 [Dioscorea zingiberensis]